MNQVHAKMLMGVEGHFDVMVLDTLTGQIREYPKCKNKILNQGLDALGALYPMNYGNGWSSGGITVGTNNTAPVATDTALHSPVAFSNNQTAGPTPSNNPTPVYASSNTIQITFGVGAVVGNIAEIGLMLQRTSGTATAGDALFSRALIQVGGSPGVITLTGTDQLIANYTSTYTYAADTTGSLNVTTDGTPVSNSFTVRPCNLQQSGSFFYVNPFSPVDIVNTGQPSCASCTDTVFAATTGSPSQSVYCNSRSVLPYTGGSYTQTFTAHWNTANATSHVMYSVQFMQMGFQMLFANAFGPTAAQTMDLTMQISWAAT